MPRATENICNIWDHIFRGTRFRIFRPREPASAHLGPRYTHVSRGSLTLIALCLLDSLKCVCICVCFPLRSPSRIDSLIVCTACNASRDKKFCNTRRNTLLTSLSLWKKSLCYFPCSPLVLLVDEAASHKFWTPWTRESSWTWTLLELFTSLERSRSLLSGKAYG